MSYPPAIAVDDTVPVERSPTDVVEFDLASLSDTERRSLGPWLERAGIAHVWRGVWLQVGAHRADDAAAIIDDLPPADDPPDPTARQAEVLGTLFGSASRQPVARPGRIGTVSMLSMTVGWLRSKFHRP